MVRIEILSNFVPMKKINLSVFFGLLIANCIFPIANCFSQDTFSICAVDTITGEVGGAGASCIDNSAIAGGVVIINDMFPGRGVIHTQSYWLAANQNNARTQFLAGLSPAQLMTWLQANDVQSNPGIRQYGAVDLDPTNGKPRSAAFTGPNCLDYKNHIVGPNYAIQGNILLGQHILDSMEARFLAEPGDLACKLMAALQGANVVGADTRCTSSGNSSLSSFLRVAKAGEVMPNIYLNLIVKSGPVGFEPIDSLQTLFNAAHSCATGVNELTAKAFRTWVYPNPAHSKLNIKLAGVVDASTGLSTGEKFLLEVFNSIGQNVLTEELKNTNENCLDISSFEGGLYFYKITLESGGVSAGKLIKN